MKRGRRRVSAQPSRPQKPATDPVASVDLSVPIKDGADTVSTLHFYRRPNFGDLEAADEAKGNIGRVLILVSRLTGLTPREAREIDASDVEAVSEVVADLLEGETDDDAVPPTGEQ